MPRARPPGVRGDEPEQPESATVSTGPGEASEWLVRLQEDDVAEADVAAWLRWCAADTANLEAFERVQRLYDQLQALSPSDRKAFLRLRPVAPERSAAPRMFRRVLSWGREHARPLVAAVAVAAIATALLVTGLSDRSPLIERAVTRLRRARRKHCCWRIARRSHWPAPPSCRHASRRRPALSICARERRSSRFSTSSRAPLS